MMAKAEHTGSPWLIVRVVSLLVAFLCSAEFIRQFPLADLSHPSWAFLPEMASIVASGVLFVLSIQKVNPLSRATWQPPRWSSNPFRFVADPIGFFHFNAWLFISLGMGCLLQGLLTYPHNWVWEIPLGAGLGAWLGVRIMSFGDGRIGMPPKSP